MLRTVTRGIALCSLVLAASLAKADEAGSRVELSNAKRTVAARAHTNLAPRTSAIDCTVGNDGLLAGRLVNAHGVPIKGTRVALAGQSRLVEQVKTDGAGIFRFKIAKSGTYVVCVNDQQVQPIRIWEQGVAPPNAKASLLLVEGAVVRAQCCETGGPACGGCESCCDTHPGFFGGAFQSILRNPWIVGAGTAAAIAIPLSTSDDDDDIGSSNIDTEEAS